MILCWASWRRGQDFWADHWGSFLWGVKVSCSFAACPLEYALILVRSNSVAYSL